MRKNIFLLFIFIGLSGILQAQVYFNSDENNYESDGNKGYIYQKEVAIDLKILQTNGFAVGVSIGQLKSYYLTRFYNIEFGEINHPREYKETLDDFTFNNQSVPKPFIYGKQNSFFVLRGGIGEKRYLTEKGKRKGLAIGVSYQAGASLGLLKPYYLNLKLRSDTDPSQLRIEARKYSEEIADRFLNIQEIYGGAGFLKGINETKIIPGGHAKLALHFAWGAFESFVRAMEVGVMADFYLQRIPIMVESPTQKDIQNSPVFFNLYLNLQLGKRK